VELAEAGYRDLTATTQGVLDGRQQGVDRPGGILLGQLGAVSDLVDQLGLRHVILLVRETVQMTLTPQADRRLRKNAPVAIDRIAWLVTVFIALLTALLLLLGGYIGYAALGLAVAISAAINLL
jgi:hypothetical protein